MANTGKKTKQISNKIITEFELNSLNDDVIKTDQDSHYFKSVLDAINSERAFLMNSKPRGLCLIICNVNYDNTKKFSPLFNYHTDARYLHKLFTQLWFKTLVVNDLKYIEFAAVFEELSKDKILTLCDAIVIIYLGHGSESSSLIATDGEPYSVSAMMEFLSAENCMTLRKRFIPKLFIINACRGDKTNHILETDNVKKVFAKSDFFEWRSTIEGHKSFTAYSPNAMTYFTRHLVEAFNDHANEIDLSDLSEEVHLKMEKEIEGSVLGQLPQFSKVVSKKFHFLPGYYTKDIEEDFNIYFKNLIQNLRERLE